MRISATRRRLLLALAASFGASPLCASSEQSHLAGLEREFGGEIGVFAIDTETGRTAGYRHVERFAMCSTFKAVLAAAVLARAETDRTLLKRPIVVQPNHLVNWSPITSQHLGRSLRVEQLCAAALRQSDNAAANLLLDILGGPAGLTSYARSLGDLSFRLDREEPALNAAEPGDVRDSTTPYAMARTLQRLLVGDALSSKARGQLRTWMLAKTTGDERIRAAAPAGWRVADKTGTGNYGNAHDIAALYPEKKAPIVLAVYSRRFDMDAEPRSDIIARATALVLRALAAGPDSRL